MMQGLNVKVYELNTSKKLHIDNKISTYFFCKLFVETMTFVWMMKESTEILE